MEWWGVGFLQGCSLASIQVVASDFRWLCFLGLEDLVVTTMIVVSKEAEFRLLDWVWS